MQEQAPGYADTRVGAVTGVAKRRNQGEALGPRHLDPTLPAPPTHTAAFPDVVAGVGEWGGDLR